jgi:hypothetical protein
LAGALLSHTEDANDPFLPHMVWFGISPLAKQDPMALLQIAKTARGQSDALDRPQASPRSRRP